MSANMNVEIQIMQDNLCDLRKIAGWTAETLAGKLGITKQTISNLENQKSQTFPGFNTLLYELFLNVKLL